MPRLPAIPIDVRLSAAWGRTILAAEKDEPHDKRLERVMRDAEAEPQDLVDLFVFVRSTPVNLANQPVEAVVESFTSWWGDALPKPWRDMDDEDLAAAVWSAAAAVPALDKVDPGKSKTASAFLATMVAVNIAAKREEDRKKAEAYRKEQVRRKQESDDAYRPKAKHKPSLTVYSQRDRKPHTIELGDPEYERKLDDVEYDNHTWASEELGVEPLPRDKWKSEQGKDTPDGWKATHMVAMVGRPDAKKQVDQILSDYEGHQRKERENSRLRNLARIDAKLRDDDRNRLEQLVREETDTAGLVEKVVSNFAPDWASGRAKARAEERLKGETAERESARTYQDYLKAKKQRGGRPLTEDEWEARYKKTAAAILSAAWGRTLRD